MHQQRPKYVPMKHHLNSNFKTWLMNYEKWVLKGAAVVSISSLIFHILQYLFHQLSKNVECKYSRTLRSKTTFGNWKPIKNDEKCFLLPLKSSFCSHIFVLTFWSKIKTAWLERYRIYSKERLCSKERPLFDVKYLMSAPLFSQKRRSFEK